MSKKVKDTDYLYLSTYLRAQEPKMLGRDRIERMLTAKTAADAARIQEECGYGTFETVTASVLEEKIAARRAAVMEDLARLAPDVRVVDAFRVRYDYHNAKVLVKSGGTRGQALLSSAGRVPPQQMEEAFSTALRVTLVGSTMPASKRSTQVPDSALKPKPFLAFRCSSTMSLAS